jgi:hypothetical protein
MIAIIAVIDAVIAAVNPVIDEEARPPAGTFRPVGLSPYAGQGGRAGGHGAPLAPTPSLVTRINTVIDTPERSPARSIQVEPGLGVKARPPRRSRLRSRRLSRHLSRRLDMGIMARALAVADSLRGGPGPDLGPGQSRRPGLHHPI